MKGRLKEMSEWCRQLMREEDLEQDEELEIGATQDMPDIDTIRDIPNDTSTEVLIFFFFLTVLCLLLFKNLGYYSYNIGERM